jgi:putative tricarboxylic transport membrane protein
MANIFMFIVQGSTIGISAKILNIPRYYLLPAVVVFCITGVLSINNYMFDVYSMMIFALSGLVLERNKYPLMPLILGFILGPMVEPYFRRTLMYYQGGVLEALSTMSVGTGLFFLAILLPVGTALLANENFRKLLKLKPKK